MKMLLLPMLLIISLNIYADYDETLISPPLKNSDDITLTSTICRTRDHLRWDVCYNQIDDKTEIMKSFRFSNDGENKIVPKSGFGIGRAFEFMFEDFARSDLGLLIWDMPDEVESHGHLKLMMFFPRLIIPSIRYISNDNEDSVIVTLPNKNEVIFNGKTKEIIGGAFSELPMAQDNDGNGTEPGIKYTGTGVVVTAHRLNDYPVGVESSSRKNQTALISKKGFKDCKVSAAELWYTDNNKGGNILFNKKFVTDEEFDKYLKKKCKFSMY